MIKVTRKFNNNESTVHIINSRNCEEVTKHFTDALPRSAVCVKACTDDRALPDVHAVNVCHSGKLGGKICSSDGQFTAYPSLGQCSIVCTGLNPCL